MTSVLTLIDFESDHFEALCSWFASERELVQWGGIAAQHPLDHVQLQRIVDERPRRLSWMAADEGRLVGHIELVLARDARAARIARVAIAPERRGRGLGRELVQLALEVAWQLDWVDRVDLRVYMWNAAALATYTRVGFVTQSVALSQREIDDERWEVATMTLERPS
ncbi:MAG: GNAT family N-acetyltransferase [Solirubrobacteraceae bacterium]